MKKKISAVLAASMIVSNFSPVVNVYANETTTEKANIIKENVETKAKVKYFNISKYSNFEKYNTDFRISRENIEKISNNGGRYNNGAKLENAFDNNLSTYWETSKPNKDEFKNSVVVEFKNLETINRIAYATRQDAVKGKGYPTKFKVYASLTEKEEDFKLVSEGEHSQTGEMMEFKFNPTTAKKIKFVFENAHDNWASASEFWFYKEDPLTEKINNLYTNEKKNELNKEYASIEKINALEKEAINHPLYNEYKEILNDAKYLLEENKVVFKEAKVSKFKNFGSKELLEYDKQYKIDNKHITNITTNGRHWASQSIDKAIDNNVDTYWHSDATNNAKHTNEVIMTLDELRTLDKIVYTSQRDRGFAKEFEVEVSKTLTGETFTKVAHGSANITRDSISIKFNPTQARRVKFIFKNGHEGWALASEFGLYKEDKVINQMDKLFTDSTMSKVNKDFDSIDKLNKLEEMCKTHPFYNDFKEDLDNAREIIGSKDIENTKAETKKFEYLSNEKYVNEFRMPYENIKSISNNAGHYDKRIIKNAIDKDLNTYWETNSGNRSDWKNEVTVEFKDSVVLDRVVYGARQTDRKGFLEEFEIYASPTTKGDTFKLVAKGNATSTLGLVEAKFSPTKFRRMKIRFVKSNQNWATFNELMFFKKDSLADKVYNLFTDDLMNNINPEYNSLDAIQKLEKEVNLHPLKNEFMELINRAKDVLNSSDKYQKNIFELESRGNSIAESQKRKVWNFQDWQPTGIAVKVGDKIKVYIDAEPSTPLPKLIFKQMDTRHNGQRIISLSRGENLITIPEVEVNDIRPGVSKAGVLYTSNPYTKEEQKRKPKVRIEGGFNYPHFIKGIDADEEVMKELKEYNEKLNKDSSLPDVFDVFSNKTLVNVKASYALDYYNKNNLRPSQTADRSDELIKETMKYWGFDNSKEVHSDWNFRYVTMVKYLDRGGFMNAGNGITGFNKAEQGGALSVDTGWGFTHEMGHNFDTTNRTLVEVTNNMLPLHFQEMKKERSKISEQNLWESKIFPKVSKEDYSKNEWYPESDKSLLTHLAPFWQLELYDETFWPRLEQQFREQNIGGGSWENKHESMAIVASDVLKLNLKEHFARHGFYVNKATAEHMAKYPEPIKKLWYLNDNKYLNDDKGFNKDIKLSVKSNITSENTKLSISLDKENTKNLLGYEIYRDNKPIGFTTKDTFVDNESNSNIDHEYKVIAYDTNLNTSPEATTKSHQPIINTVGGLTLSINEKYNPLDYVSANSYDGKKITDIKIKDNVDNTKKGDYTIEYEVTDKGSTVKEIMNVHVVNEYDYLSDTQWDSYQTEHATPSRNDSIKGRVLGEVKNYEKGIRLHANGNVVYNLGNHNYDNFEVKVGVDMNITPQNYSSITFKVIGDDNVLATTKVLRHSDNMVYINVPIKNVKQLRLEVNDGGNGRTSDHSVFVEPKLTTNNAKPKLTIPKSKTVKVGSTLDNLVGDYSAKDAEDGVLTDKVEITGQDNVNLNRIGNYELTYSITDKDGNKTEKTRTISVISEKDFTYLSDYDWKSATKGWGTIGKDVSIDKRTLTLTDKDNKAITYKKGIGTHAHSEIVYDLSDKNSNMFSAFVGVDREVYHSPASVEFKVYVDGDLAYESGVMRSKDAQKLVEVDITDAKELKLVATTAGDGGGSDHADWADAKLYFVNTNRLDTTDLTKSIEEAKKIEKDNYTDESIVILNNSLAKAEEILAQKDIKQEEVDIATKNLKAAIKSLSQVDFNKVVTIEDKNLNIAIRKELNKENGDLTIGDMYKLTSLTVEDGIESLEGLQYAKKIVSLTVGIGSIKDFKPLMNLSKLETVKFEKQYITIGELYHSENKIKVNTEIYNRKNKNISKKVSIIKGDGTLVKEVVLNNDTNEVTIDTKDISSGVYGVHVTFEDEEVNGIVVYMTRI